MYKQSVKGMILLPRRRAVSARGRASPRRGGIVGVGAGVGLPVAGVGGAVTGVGAGVGCGVGSGVQVGSAVVGAGVGTRVVGVGCCSHALTGPTNKSTFPVLPDV